MIESIDQTDFIQHSVGEALQAKCPLDIVGGASKSFYARLPEGEKLFINAHQGIVNYHPSELVITARTGTLLSDIQNTLAEQGQMLAFEAPSFSPLATLGGVIACGFSGPRRPFSGAVRDFVLGCKIIDGNAHVLSFGGEVMKNVAGYDVSRLMVGAMGTLGVMLEVSLKVLPKPAVEYTRIFEMNFSEARKKMIALSNQSLPLSGLSFDGEKLYVRFSGTERVVMAASQKVGGDNFEKAEQFWQDCNEHQTAFFLSSQKLWRISVPPASPELSLSGQWFYEWGGAQRWLITSEADKAVFSQAEAVNGHATLFRTQDRSAVLFQPMPEALQKINRNIKTAFDPEGLFNPFRLHMEW